LRAVVHWYYKKVIPIQWTASFSEIDDLLGKINGVLLTGGDTDIYLNFSSPGYKYNKFTKTVSYIVKKAI
jgi:hypothetical protein